MADLVTIDKRTTQVACAPIRPPKPQQVFHNHRLPRGANPAPALREAPDLDRSLGQTKVYRTATNTSQVAGTVRAR